MFWQDDQRAHMSNLSLEILVVVGSILVGFGVIAVLVAFATSRLSRGGIKKGRKQT